MNPTALTPFENKFVLPIFEAFSYIFADKDGKPIILE